MENRSPQGAARVLHQANVAGLLQVLELCINTQTRSHFQGEDLFNEKLFGQEIPKRLP